MQFHYDFHVKFHILKREIPIVDVKCFAESEISVILEFHIAQVNNVLKSRSCKLSEFFTFFVVCKKVKFQSLIHFRHLSIIYGCI